MDDDWNYWREQYIRELNLDNECASFNAYSKVGVENEISLGPYQDNSIELPCHQSFPFECPVLPRSWSSRKVSLPDTVYIPTFWPCKRFRQPKVMVGRMPRNSQPSSYLDPPLLPACPYTIEFDSVVSENGLDLPSPQFSHDCPEAPEPRFTVIVGNKVVKSLEPLLSMNSYCSDEALIPFTPTLIVRPSFPLARIINGRLERIPAIKVQFNLDKHFEYQYSWNPGFAKVRPIARFSKATAMHNEPLLQQEEPQLGPGTQITRDFSVSPLPSQNALNSIALSGTIMLNRTVLQNRELIKVLDGHENLCIIEREFVEGFEILAYSSRECIFLLNQQGHNEELGKFEQHSKLFDQMYIMMMVDNASDW